MDLDRFVMIVLGYAEMHGAEDDPDHEVGDLQDVVRALAGRLSPGDRQAVLDELSEDWDDERLAAAKDDA